MTMDPKMIFEIVLRILADRVLLFVTLFMNAAIYGYAVYAPDPWRWAVAVSFSIAVFIPVLKIKSRGVNTTEAEREAA